MIVVLNGILKSLKTEGMGEIYDEVLSDCNSAHVMLTRLRDEKMSVDRAIETFKSLHADLNDCIAKLPKDNKKINILVEQLVYYQKREYKDLITELNMDKDKKAQLKKLWSQVTDEEKGSGVAQVA